MNCSSPKMKIQAKLSQNKNQMDTSMVLTYARHNQARSPMVFIVIFCTLFLFTSFSFDFSFDFEFFSCFCFVFPLFSFHGSILLRVQYFSAVCMTNPMATMQHTPYTNW